MKWYIELGDTSNDGHGKIEKMYVTCNKSIKELQDTYITLVKKTNFDFMEEVAMKFGDDTIKKERAQLFFDWGFDFKTLEKLHDSPLTLENVVTGNKVVESIPLSAEDYVELLLFYIKQELSDLEWDFSDDDVPELFMNEYKGYGLL